MSKIVPAYTIHGEIPGKEGISVYRQGILINPNLSIYTGLSKSTEDFFYPVETPEGISVPELDSEDIPLVVKTCLYPKFKVGKEGIFISHFTLKDDVLIASPEPKPRKVKKDKALVLWQINATGHDGHKIKEGFKKVEILQEGEFDGKDRHGTKVRGKTLLVLIEKGGELVVEQYYFQWFGRSSHFTLYFPKESKTPIAFAKYNTDHNAGKMMFGKKAEKRA
ncbi:hypothetical protein ACFL24_00250 [Patescibacteria group bacterium]